MGRGENMGMRGSERRRSGARGGEVIPGSLAGWCSREEVMGRRGGLYREEGGENYSVWWGKESQSECYYTSGEVLDRRRCQIKFRVRCP